jgi:hypothetical protein
MLRFFSLEISYDKSLKCVHPLQQQPYSNTLSSSCAPSTRVLSLTAHVASRPRLPIDELMFFIRWDLVRDGDANRITDVWVFMVRQLSFEKLAIQINREFYRSYAALYFSIY